MKLEIDIHHHFTGDEEQRPQPADPRLLEMMERIMSQLEDLQADSTAITADLGLIKDHLVSQSDKLASLTAQLEQLQQSVPPQVDLSGVVAAANDIRSEADAIVASFTPAPADGGSAGDGSAPVDGSTGGADAGAGDGSTGTADGSGGTVDAGGADAGAGATDGSAGTTDAGGGDVSGTQGDAQPE